MPEVMGLGHVGLVCDDLMKMRDFYSRVIGLTITDENLDRGTCFLSADPKNEHHELNLGQSRGPDHPLGARPKTSGVGQVSFLVNSVDDVRDFYHRLQDEGVRIRNTLTHGVSISVYFFDPEENVVELYYKTGFNIRQPLGEHIDLEKPTEELLAIAKSFEDTVGPPLGAQQLFD